MRLVSSSVARRTNSPLVWISRVFVFWLRVLAASFTPRTRLTTRPVRTRAASASFDPLCEFINPLLPVEDQLECGQGVDEAEEPAPVDDEYDDEYGEYEA